MRVEDSSGLYESGTGSGVPRIDIDILYTESTHLVIAGHQNRSDFSAKDFSWECQGFQRPIRVRKESGVPRIDVLCTSRNAPGDIVVCSHGRSSAIRISAPWIARFSSAEGIHIAPPTAVSYHIRIDLWLELAHENPLSSN